MMKSELLDGGVFNAGLFIFALRYETHRINNDVVISIIKALHICYNTVINVYVVKMYRTNYSRLFTQND